MNARVILPIMILAGMVGAVGQRYYSHRQATALFLDYIAQGDQAYRNGQYQNALNLYHQAHDMKSIPAAAERIELARQTLEDQKRQANIPAKSAAPRSESQAQAARRTPKKRSSSPVHQAKLDTSAFVKVAWLDGASKNQVVIIGPPCDSPEGNRARQLVKSLQDRSISSTFSTSLSISTGGADPALLDAWNQVMKGSPPIVFINGTAKANPTLNEILDQYRNTILNNSPQRAAE